MSSNNHLVEFQNAETGGITAYALGFLLTGLAFGGVSFDVAYAYKARTELQVAADAAAHAAIYVRQSGGSLAEARAAAVEMAQRNLPPVAFGEVLEPLDVNFGNWDATTEQFEVDNFETDMVSVNVARSQARANAVPGFLLSFVGLDDWDVDTGAVFESYMPACLREGFVAQDFVDVQSNNVFTNGFCIHSNAYVKVSSNNSFAPGTTVSMPDKSDIDMPNSGFATNIGLEEALAEQKYTIRILNHMADIIAGLWNTETDYIPDYIYGLGPIDLSGKKFDASDFTPHRVHRKDCSTGGNKITIEPNTLLENLVLVTNCEVNFGQGVVLENVVIATNNTGASSFKAASGLQVGRDDQCLPDGGAQLLTMGGMQFPADLKVYGGQLIAKLDIEFAANANGIEGASFISGENISGTSNMTMGHCGDGMERNFEAEYFRLAG